MEIDTTLGINWIHAQYIGDAVYAMDVTEYGGVVAIGLRTDRLEEGTDRIVSHVIVLEPDMVEKIAELNKNTIAKWQRIQRERAEVESSDGR